MSADKAELLERLRALADSGPAAPDRAYESAMAEAKEVALRRLDVRPRTRAELEGDLAARGIAPDVVDAVVGRLAEAGLVDDAEFARQWVEQRRDGKGLSAAKLREELRAKGVAADIIEAALAEDEGDDATVAFDLARKKARTMTGLDRTTFERRLAGLLARRGFPESVVRRVVFTLADERASSA